MPLGIVYGRVVAVAQINVLQVRENGHLDAIGVSLDDGTSVGRYVFGAAAKNYVESSVKVRLSASGSDVIVVVPFLLQVN